MKINSIVRAAVIGGAVAFAALTGATAQSEAAPFKPAPTFDNAAAQNQVHNIGHRFKKKFKFRKFHFHHNHRHHDCGYYKWKWKHTGSFHWKKKYYKCKGWW